MTTIRIHRYTSPSLGAASRALALACVVFCASVGHAIVPDSDNDGVLDNADNCQFVANANQRDTDNDGFGNLCDADLNNNGIVNALDLGIFKVAFFSTPAAPNWNPNADFNGDNIVNALDLGRLKLSFFLPPGPVGYARWNVNTSGNWSNPANWFPAAVPGATSHVLIDRPVPVTVTYNAAAGSRTVATVVSNHPLILAGGELTVLDTVQVNATFTLGGGRLKGARVLPGGGGQGLTAAANTTSWLDGVTLAANMVIVNGGNVYSSNGLTLNNANITLASNGTAYSLLIFQGTQTLGGTGELRFGGTTTSDALNWVYQSYGGHVLTVDAGITTRTQTSGGFLGWSPTGLISRGAVVANLAGRKITLAGSPMDIQGPATASGGGHLDVTGNWTNAAGNALAMSGGGALTLAGTWQNDGSISATNSTLLVGLQAADAWTNNGAINLVNSPATLGGTVTQANLTSLTTNSSILVTGNLLNSGQTLNLATLPALSFGSGARITGGTIAGAGGFAVAADSIITVDGVTLATDMLVDNGSTVNVENGLTLNNADITLASTGTGYAILAFQGTQSLAGTGELLFGGTTTLDYLNWVYQSYGGGQVLTIEPGVTTRTLTAGGALGWSATGMTSRGAVISNLAGRQIALNGSPLSVEGPVTASSGGHLQFAGDWSNAAGNTVTVSGGGTLTLAGTWENNGTLSATDSTVIAGLQGADAWTNNGAINLVNSPATLGGTVTQANLTSLTTNSSILVTGNLLNSGQTLNLDSLPPLSFGAGAGITGGTIAGASGLVIPDGIYMTFDGIVLATGMTIQNGATANVTNGLTLDNANVTLTSDGTQYAFLVFQGTQSLAGTGELRFGGTTTFDYLNWVYQSYGGNTLTIEPGITVRALTAGGQLGWTSAGLTLRGAVISDLAGRDIAINGAPLSVEGSLSIGSDATLTSTSTAVTLTPTAALDIDIGPAGPGYLQSSGATHLDGTLNLALVGGASPAPCATFDVAGYLGFTGAFAAVNGPDFGGSTFSPLYLATRARVMRPGTGCTMNHSELAGVTVVASSVFSPSYAGELAIDGVNATNSSWCTANNDPSPSLRVTLPATMQVNELRIRTSYSPAYDFLTGRFLVRNAANVVIRDTGVVALAGGEITLDLVPDVANARSVEFLGVTWNSIEPCLGELEIIGPVN